MADIVEALVDGGRASGGPPLGPALGPKGVNIPQVIALINQKTKAFDGMKVPVKIIIEADKSFDVKVGTPPVSALIKNELGISKGSGNPKTEIVGNLSIDQIKKVAEQKQDSLLGATEKARVLEVAGNCVSMGVTVDGKAPKVFQKDVKAGVYDDQLQH